MQPILVTGGAGFIGATFVRRWLGAGGGPVINLDKLTYAGNPESLGAALLDPAHRLVVADVCCAESVSKAFEDARPWAVVHFAAESHVDRSIDGPAPFVTTNIGGTFELLRCAHDYWQDLSDVERRRFRFLHVSTDEVYGSAAPGAVFHESSPYAPNSPYAASKAAADHLVRAYHRTYGLPTLISHCSNNYGPYQFPEKLIPFMILAAQAGRPLPVYGDGLQERDWLYVEDHCRALELILENGRPGEVYHVGTGQTLTNREVVEAICEQVDETCPDLAWRPTSNLIKCVPDRAGHDRRYCVDSGKIRRELGWAPQWTFADGLRRTVAWYLANDAWIERVVSDKYRWERLGLRRESSKASSESAL